MQGHAVIVVGVGEGWIRELPAVVGDAEAAATSSSSRRKDGAERMKIAWRYERLGEFGSGLAGSSRGTLPPTYRLLEAR